MSDTHGAEDDLSKEKFVPRLPTNLARIGAMYKFRVRVPKDLLEHYAPKREIIESLKTKDLAEARRRLLVVQKRYHDEWESIRQANFETRLKTPALQHPSDVKHLPITPDVIEYLSSLLAHDSLAGDEQTREAGNYTIEEIREYRSRLSESIAELRDLISIGDTDSLLPNALQLLYFKQIEVTGSEEDYRRLSLAYARAALQTNEALLKKMNGEAVTPPPVKLPNQLTKAKIPLYSLFEYWRDLVPNRSKRTVEDVERRINQFDALTKHKSAELLTKADAIAYRDQLIAKGKATRTVAKDLSYIKAVLQAAADADKIPSNPAALIKVPKAKGASGPKRILNNDDLTVLFGSDIYTKNKRPTGGGGEAAAWVPLIALYTGARLEEICQLTVDDVKTEAKIPHFRIQLIDEGNAGVQKVLKTEGSQRDVPIHQGLIKAGLLKYVDHLRSQKQIWLFPDLKPDTYGRRGGNFTKWWSRWRDSLDVGGTHRCFHAFRHTFKTACRHAAIGEDFHDAITGHAGGGEGRGYGHFPLEALNAQLQDVAYPELHFLWSWSAT